MEVFMTARKALENCVLYVRKAKKLKLPTALTSQILHCVTFTIERPKTQFESAMVIFSVDVDVGNKALGLINQGKNDSHVHKFYRECRVGEIEEQALPLFVDVFNEFKVPVTFAIRGQLTEIDDHFLPFLLSSPVKHDIGAHGYSHRKFSDLSQNEAETELNLLSVGMKKFGIIPRSFVFPRNIVSHLDLLERFGYECYREAGDFLNDGMYIERRGRLYDIHPSLYLSQDSRVVFLKKILNIAVEKRTPLHLWFHPWSFGETNTQIKRKIKDLLIPFLDYAKTKEETQALKFETMLSAARKANNMLKNT